MPHPPSPRPAEVGTHAHTGLGPLRTCARLAEVPEAGVRRPASGPGLGEKPQETISASRAGGEHSAPNKPQASAQRPPQPKRATIGSLGLGAHAGLQTHEDPAPGRRALTGHGEVVEGRLALLQVLRPLLVADEGAVILQEEVARPPRLDVLSCGCGGWA